MAYKAKQLISIIYTIYFLSISHVVYAENTNRAAAESVCQRSDILLCENWEDGDHVGWADFYSWDGDNYGGHTCSTGGCPFSYEGYQSSQAIIARLPANDPDSIYPSAEFNTRAGVNATLYARYNVFWSPGFEFNTGNTKNFYFRTNSGRYRVGMFFRPGRPSLYTDETEDVTTAVPYIHLYCNQIEVVPGGEVEQYCHSQGGDMRYFPNQPGTSDFRLRGGRWYTVEVRVTPNPSGQAFGGRLQYWIDGVLMGDFSNVSIRKTGETDPINSVWITSYFGGGGQNTHPTQYVLYDNIVVGQSRIGLPANTVSNPSPPTLE